MPGENRVDELRNDGVFVADDAGEQRVLQANELGEVVAHFVADRPPPDLAARDRCFQLSKSFKTWRGRHISVYYDSRAPFGVSLERIGVFDGLSGGNSY